jgi:helix-turn-helix protein
MSPDDKNNVKLGMLQGVKSETLKCYRKGMSVDQILAPSYSNKDFMLILQYLGVDKDKLKEIVEGYIQEELNGKFNN